MRTGLEMVDFVQYREAFSEISNAAGPSTDAQLACPVHASTLHVV